MKIAIGNDHAAPELKNAVRKEICSPTIMKHVFVVRYPFSSK